MNNGGYLHLVFIIITCCYLTNACDPDHLEDGCEILENPKTVVASVNDTAVTISCGINEAELHFVFDDSFNSDRISEDQMLYYQERGIYWDCNKDEMKCSVTIDTIQKNDGFTVQCVLFDCCTQIATLHIVNDAPNPPDPPQVKNLNASSLNVSWNSPWVYPIVSYTLNIIDNSSIVTTIPTNNTNYIFNKPDDYNCEEYEFIVSANTDIGETDFSESTTGTFPMDIDNVLSNDESFIKSIIKFSCGTTPTYRIIGDESARSNVCPHETLQYEYQLSVTTTLVIVPDNSTPVVFLKQQNGFLADDLEITEIIVNEFQQTANVSEFLDFSSDDIVTYSGKSVVIHPFTTVALVNTMANFTCSTDNTDHQPMVIINGKIITDAQLNETGITVVQSVPLQGFIIMIPASVDTNGTTVQCFVSPCITDEAYLIVVNSRPSSIIPILVANNETVLNISWRSPWPYPVGHYIVKIHDDATVSNYSTSNTFHLYTEPGGFECKQIIVTVQAVTDVGITEANEKNITFYKGLKNLDIINSTKVYNFYEGNASTSPILEIIFKSPLTCSHEVLSYQFELRNLKLDGDMLTMHTTNTTRVQFQLNNYLLRDDTLSLAVSVNVTDGMDYVNIQLFDNISIVVTDVIPMKKSTSSSSVVIGFGVVGVIVVVVIIIVLIFSFVSSYICLKRIAKNKRARIFRADGTRNVTTDAINFTLPPMVVNTQYSTADEVLYETINEMTVYPTYTTISDTVGPSLPPRKTLENPLNCNGGPVTELTTKMTTKGDEYVEMANTNTETTSPRYVPAPTFNKIETEDESTAFDFENPGKSGE